MVARLCASWFFLAIERGASVCLDEPLFDAPTQESIESAKDEVSLAIGPSHGFEHDADHCWGERGEGKRVGFHQPDGFAGVMNGFAARGFGGLSAVHKRGDVGAEGFVDRRRQDCSLGYGGGCGGQSFVMRASSCLTSALAASAAVRASATVISIASPNSCRTPPPQRLPVEGLMPRGW